MQIRVGYELVYECSQPTPMILMLNIHFTRVSDLVIADHIITSPPTPITAYRDGFGNWCSRIVAPPGEIRISTNALISDSGLPDKVDPFAPQHAVEDLPAETLVFLLGSRYCETDRLTETPGPSSGRRPSDGRASRQSAISSMDISPSASSMPGRPGPRSKFSTSAWACVAFTPTSRLPSVAA
jgi:transglutaminase-like putative cysteine protease